VVVLYMELWWMPAVDMLLWGVGQGVYRVG